MTYRTYICGPTTCPNDSDFEHDGWFGCVPVDFSSRTGRSKKHRQRRVEVPTGIGYRLLWDGGCDALTEQARA